MRFPRAILVSAAVAVLSSAGLAQDAEPKGLDALGDERLYTELAKRNLNSLLDSAFEKNNVSGEKREAILAGAALARLQADKALGVADKRKLVAEFVKALPQLLPQMNDATSLLTNANLLIVHGVTTDQRQLEYFGPNSSTMTRLNPVTSASRQILAKAKEAAAAAADAAANNWPAGKPAWERNDLLATTADYTRNVLAYGHALSLDKASEERGKVLADGVEYLEQFDAPALPEGSDPKFFNGNKLYLAKLYLAQASPDSLAKAKAALTYVIQNGDPKDISTQYDARVTLALVAIAAKDAAAAEAAIKDLETWVVQSKVLANNPGFEPEVKAATGGLRARNLLAQGKPGEADKVLDKLQQDVPALRGVILELMAANVRPDAPVKDLNNLLLQGLRAKAEAEVIKPADAPFDKEAVQRGIDATLELIKRGGKDNEQVVQDSQYVLGFLYQKLGKNPEAANAFLDYAEKHNKKPEDLDRANTALSNGIALVGELYRTQMGDPAVTKLYDRTLDLAVAKPFERLQFAFERARRLQAKGSLDEAIKMYDLVKSDSKQYDEAQYFKMVAIRSKLDKLQPGAKDRPALLAELQKLADTVTKAYEGKLASATPEVAMVLRTRLAQTRLVAADVALVDQKDPKRALQLLEGFENATKGLPNADNLLSQVLLIRVKSYVQANLVAEGVKEIQKLANDRPKEAMQIIFDLMDKLNEQVTAADAAKREDEVANLERTRAELTPVLVKLIRESNNAELKKFDYQISVYDAEQQRRAAELTKDEAKRKDLMQAALKRFEAMDAKDQFEKYVAALDKDKQAKARQAGYDPQVKLGLARANFDLGNWDAARRPLALLFRDKVLGDGVIVKFGPDGQAESVDNPTYWEAVLMLIRSNLALNEGTDAMKTWLTGLSNTWKGDLGGQRWADEFKKLQSDLGVQPVKDPQPETASK